MFLVVFGRAQVGISLQRKHPRGPMIKSISQLTRVSCKTLGREPEALLYLASYMYSCRDGRNGRRGVNVAQARVKDRGTEQVTAKSFRSISDTLSSLTVSSLSVLSFPILQHFFAPRALGLSAETVHDLGITIPGAMEVTMDFSRQDKFASCHVYLAL